jgi:large subunit ribosomal protein L5
MLKEIRIEKVTLNIGVGSTGEKLEAAKTLLKMLTGQKPIETKARDRIPTWNVRPGLPIGTKVTLRGKKAQEVLKKCLESVDNQVKSKNFDKSGNFAFGIREYIEIPGVRYDPKIGMFGFDVMVTLERPGYRVKKRKRAPRKIPTVHRITKNDAMDYVTKNFKVEIE